jgi:hypothetical protein
MYRGMTRGMKAHVSTMLTESGLSIALPVRHFKESVRPKAGCKPTSTAFRVLVVLTMRTLGPNRNHVPRSRWQWHSASAECRPPHEETAP